MANPQIESPTLWPSWLVWAKVEGTSLDPLLARLAEDAETELVKTLGPPAQPHTVVVKMSAETAQHYQEDLRDEYLFELNAPLTPQVTSA